MDPEREPTRPWACFDRRYAVVALGVGAAVIVIALLMKRSAPGSPARLAFGAIEAGLIAGLALYTVAAIRKLDELAQRIQLEAIAIAFALSAAIFSGYGMLAQVGLPAIDFGLWAWPVMALLWALAAFVVQRRYR